jgi:hypothetical protein
MSPQNLRNALRLVSVCLVAIVAPAASAAVYDLATETTIVVPTSTGSAIFTTDFIRTAGTGTYDPFLTIQADNTEKGYNTSAGIYDTKRVPSWNHELRLSDLEPTRITYMGADYYTFTLDVNEENGGGKSLISLDTLKIYLSKTVGQTTPDPDLLGSLVFDLDSLQDNVVLYDDKVSGSGQGDIAFFVPVSAFEGALPDTYVYMYQEFGNHNVSYGAGGGYEETRLAVGIRPVPEPSAVLPLVGVLGFALSSRRLWRSKR